jgi:hypothetical protein
MNKSKVTALTALATVMSASAAYADLSLSGAVAGMARSGDATTGLSHGVSTSSVYIAYTSSLDNGFGLSAGFSVTSGSNNFTVGIDSGMYGSVAFGEFHSGAVDVVDAMPAGVNHSSSTAELGVYSDGDGESGMGIMYTSPTFANLGNMQLRGSMGENVCDADGNCNDERVSAMSVTASIAGVGLKAGSVNQEGANGDDTFMNIGYTFAGVTAGYGNYDSDGTGDSTIFGLNKTFENGITLGYEFEDWDSGTAAADQDMSKYSVSKSFGGGMSATMAFKDTDAGTGVDNENWSVYYSVGF